MHYPPQKGVPTVTDAIVLVVGSVSVLNYREIRQTLRFEGLRPLIVRVTKQQVQQYDNPVLERLESLIDLGGHPESPEEQAFVEKWRASAGKMGLQDMADYTIDCLEIIWGVDPRTIYGIIMDEDTRDIPERSYLDDLHQEVFPNLRHRRVVHAKWVETI